MENDWPLEHDREFASGFTKEELTAKQQENAWLRLGGPDKEPDAPGFWYPSYDYSYSYYVCETLDELKRAFLYGNWAIRQAFIYKNLAFVNQVNAGDEWWTLKKFEDGEIIAFESCSMVPIINHGEGHFEDYIPQMLKATKEQCRKLEVLDDEFRRKYRARPSPLF